MQQMPPARRPGRSSRTQQAPVRKKRKSRKGVIAGLIVFIAALARIVVVSPKEPIRRAS